jgi:hypothetical protein
MHALLDKSNKLGVGIRGGKRGRESREPFQSAEALSVGRHGIDDGRRQRVGGVANAQGDELSARVCRQILLFVCLLLSLVCMQP